ncbi:MAG: right-handed parallel beta-helix repeat-containing protein, partial [Thermoplasmata archaeon]
MGRKVIAIWLSLIMMVSFVVIVDVSLDISLNVGGATLYVNTTGSGGAYTKIQDAIDAANPGNTIFVYNGTYNENIVVNKPINLTGENMDFTIIDGGENEDVVKITTNNVNITGFTVTRGRWMGDDAGIELNNVQNCSIFNNNISSNRNYGIRLYYSNINNITDNIISFNDEDGIYLHFSDNNEIKDNNISYNPYSIGLRFSNNNTIINNTIFNHLYGINVWESNWNNISKNNVSFNKWYGIYFQESSWNIAINNTMIDNGIIISGGSIEHYNTHTINISNKVNGKPVYYWKNQTGGAVPPGAGQV